ncbi:2-C-methyl-D-erythritol 4-phosphate cytidylyltransferase [Pedobacter psychrophilus]|uniref:2-C-methyl-D-erythritol 4-phosphate cytidylyltransferase n=1 Tax=Pedobacter psychrophilus TaxID=1826909 RepID=A0A179DEV5_9SPHI|nr:2-C-methyl-D-erythritol 4-phosphate cytidylyltransferase [Pedobacter psychrophilus]OAQ39577.1 2-C-methyl-D-erythritol 4-phosphate cytidylyltransferase [Pedobacter psychrophilus]
MSHQNTFYTIIVAGGSGSRMSSDIPKQFLKANGLPILMHTINTFHLNKYQPQIILVLANADEKLWHDLIEEYSFKVPHQIVFGGEQRFYSVKNGLEKIKEENAIIAIHDAVRPLVSQNTISNCFETAVTKGNAIAAIPSKDSIRKLTNGKTEALDRKEIYLVQTPQTFQHPQLKKAYQQNYQDLFTDDASVVENAGFDINLEKGDEFNFKITFKEDLIIAETLLNL